MQRSYIATIIIFLDILKIVECYGMHSDVELTNDQFGSLELWTIPIQRTMLTLEFVLRNSIVRILLFG